MLWKAGTIQTALHDLSTDLDPVCVNEEEGHGLDDDLEEEVGVVQEAADHDWVRPGRGQELGQVPSQLLMHGLLLAALGDGVGPENKLQVARRKSMRQGFQKSH